MSFPVLAVDEPSSGEISNITQVPLISAGSDGVSAGSAPESQDDEAGSLLTDLLRAYPGMDMATGMTRIARCMARCATGKQPLYTTITETPEEESADAGEEGTVEAADAGAPPAVPGAGDQTAPAVTCPPAEGQAAPAEPAPDEDTLTYVKPLPYNALTAARCVASCVGVVARDTSQEIWRRQLSLGVLTTGGNADTTTYNGRFGVEHELGTRKDELAIEGMVSTFGKITTARRYVASMRTRHNFSENNYWFGNGRFETDRSTGYEHQATLVGGVGRRFLQRETVYIDAETGAGWRNSERLNETMIDDLVFRFAGKLQWDIVPGTLFTQDLLMETGEVASDNTRTESVTALTVAGFGGLALRWSVTVFNNSQVPDGVKHTDVINSVNLVYDF